MAYSIKVQLHFSAAHNLRGHQGKCEVLHGHNWRVEVKISSTGLNKIGMVCDFKEVRKRLEQVLDKLDHSYLNKLPYFKKHNPTSENIAEFIYYKLKKQIKTMGLNLAEVRVWETDSSSAVFNEDV